MSSAIRKMQRQVVGTKASRFYVLGKFKGCVEAPARGVFFNERGVRLGVSNPEAKDRLARLAREAKKGEL